MNIMYIILTFGFLTKLNANDMNKIITRLIDPQQWNNDVFLLNSKMPQTKNHEVYNGITNSLHVGFDETK